MQITENQDLTQYNTFHVPAKARYFVLVENKSELPQLIDFANHKQLPILILGQGSNVLFTRDLNMIVTKFNFSNLQITSQTHDSTIVQVQAGKTWDDFVAWTVENNLYGAVNLSFIPGTVGAAPVQNIGAYGTEVAQIIEKVEVFDLQTLNFTEIHKQNCQFAYRSSIFKTQLKNKAFITSVTFKLSKKPYFNLQYKDLQHLKNNPGLNLQLLRQTIGQIRHKKLPDPKTIGNAGSFFKNPIVSKEQARQLKDRWPQMPQYQLNNAVKIPAGWLIDNLGLKGYKMGQAAVYQHNALVLVNLGNATGKQILKLANFIIDKVFEIYKIKLEPEVNIF